MPQMPIVGEMADVKRRTDFADFILVVACGLGMSFTLLLLASMPLMPALSGSRDYLVYWATGQQLVHHANPYDAEQMARLEHQAGLTLAGSYYMRNPPWAFPLAYPLGFIPERVGALPWSLLLLGVLAVSVRMICRTLYAGKPEIGMLGYCFPAALIAVEMGQISLLLLLGLVLFIHLHDRRPYLAGASLWLCTLKPHLLLPFGLVLLVWIVRNRSYKLVVGFGAAVMASCALTEWIDPTAWQQYLQWARSSGIQSEFIPCLGVLVRQWISPTTGWLAFAPALAASCWAVAFYWSRRERWDWFGDGGALVLISIFVAPYCWIWDQSLALPALLHSANRTTSRRMLGVLGVLYLSIQIMQFTGVPQRSVLYLWPALALPVWNFLARHRQPADQARQLAVACGK
jgi:hypothetical protein